MRLINNFFHIDSMETTGDTFRCKVHMNEDHNIYKVHFPGNPITPGVCLIQMGTEILGQILHKNLQLKIAKEIKFKKALEPTDKPTFVFTKMAQEDGGFMRANISIEDDCGNQFAMMKLRYQEG